MRRGLAILFAVAFAATGVAASEPPPNFGVVIENGIYRGGQPTTSDLEYLRSLGVKTILKLNSRGLKEEQETAKKLGLKLINVSLDPSTVGSPDTCGDVERALAVLQDQTNWPVYAHCSIGRDRTGYIIGVYREIVQQWTWEKVDAELARFGHRGVVRRAYPKISRDLRENGAACDHFRALTRIPVQVR